MNNLNSILLEGNLTRDPEIKYSAKGNCICEFAIASNRFIKLDNEYQKEVSFFNVVTWSKLAETCSEHLKKGRGVRVVGRLKQDRWTNEEGENRARIYIIAEHVEFKPDFSQHSQSAKKRHSVVEENLTEHVTY